jgi:hypothetical protein
LVEESGGEDAEKEAQPEGWMNGFQPCAEQTTYDDSSRHHQRQAKPAGKRSLGIGDRQQEAGDRPDQRTVRLAAQDADHDRQPDIGEEQKPAAPVEITPQLGERR